MILLGSTGSIGDSVLKIARRFQLPVETLVAGRNIDLLNQQIAEFQPKTVVIADASSRDSVQHRHVLWGESGIIEALQAAESSIVVNALVGFLGLRPTIESIRLGKTVALANKESLVAAGKFVDASKLRPIDSEHFGLQFLLGQQPHPVQSMVITASGGAFRDRPIEQIAQSTKEEALQHPNWTMGDKITIDSATMANKLFEILEAYWLFDCSELDAVIESRSLIHALIHFKDGSTTAHFANPDMQLPIAHALIPDLQDLILPPVDLTSMGCIDFQPISPERYPIWQLKQPLLELPELGVVVNAANEVAVQQFLSGDIPFGEIARIVLETFAHFENRSVESIEACFALDEETRRYATKINSI